jgi:hypothetical protein
MSNFTIYRNGQLLGDFTGGQILPMLQSRQLLGTDQALPEGGTEWKTLFELFPPPPQFAKPRKKSKKGT